jgi:hypothetical protein
MLVVERGHVVALIGRHRHNFFPVIELEVSGVVSIRHTHTDFSFGGRPKTPPPTLSNLPAEYP